MQILVLILRSWNLKKLAPGLFPSDGVSWGMNQTGPFFVLQSTPTPGRRKWISLSAGCAGGLRSEASGRVSVGLLLHPPPRFLPRWGAVVGESVTEPPSTWGAPALCLQNPTWKLLVGSPIQSGTRAGSSQRGDTQRGLGRHHRLSHKSCCPWR